MTTHIHGVSTRLAVPGHTFVRATWIYRSTDPLAVTLAVFGERRRWPVEWQLSRQLLGAAFSGPVGDGDVALCVDAGGLHIRLSSPDGEAELTGDSVVAWNFLADTFTILAPCPAGWCGDCEECAVVGEALDVELDSIMREATA